VTFTGLTVTKLIIVVLAIVAIVVLEVVALQVGANGKALSLSIGLIAALGGAVGRGLLPH